MSVDPAQFKDALSRYATGVTVVTAVMPDGRLAGVTVSSFCSVSLRPPLVLFCLANTSTCLKAFTEGERCAVNILAESQRDLSVAFSTQSTDKFRGVSFERSAHGLPLLSGCLANIECAREAVYEGGDHVILVGRVEHITLSEDGAPLVYHRGAYRRATDPL